MHYATVPQYYFLPWGTDVLCSIREVNGFLVSKETVLLRRWESETKIRFYQTS